MLNDIDGMQRILVKPNIVSLEPYPTTTDPAVLKLVVKALLECNKAVVVADGPAPDGFMMFRCKHSPSEARRLAQAFRAGMENRWNHGWKDGLPFPVARRIRKYSSWVMKRHSLKRALRSHPVTIQDIHRFSFRDMTVISPSAEEVHLQIMDCSSFDGIVNLPVLKLHTSAGFTAARKNLFGLLSPFSKMMCHRAGIVQQAIGILPRTLQVPTVSILDAYLVPNAQERRWIDQRISWELRTVIYGYPAEQVDKDAYELLVKNGLL